MLREVANAIQLAAAIVVGSLVGSCGDATVVTSTEQAVRVETRDLGPPPGMKGGHRDPVRREPPRRENVHVDSCPLDLPARADWNDLVTSKARTKAERAAMPRVGIPVPPPTAEHLQRQAAFQQRLEFEQQRLDGLAEDAREQAYAALKASFFEE